MKKIFFTIATILTFSACGGGNAKQDFDQMAKDLCNCMRPLADMNQKIKQLVNEGKTTEVANLFTEVERLATEGEVCATSLEDKYGIVEKESEDKAAAALKKHCPDIAKMLDQSEAMSQ